MTKLNDFGKFFSIENMECGSGSVASMILVPGERWPAG